jgi:hypothetical protein
LKKTGFRKSQSGRGKIEEQHGHPVGTENQALSGIFSFYKQVVSWMGQARPL